MIDKVKLTNFQVHRRLVLKLTDGVNTLVGETDAGKSSVIRAIGWCALNQPGGTAFTSWGESACRVLVVTDGRRVVRKRSKSENSYTLDGKRFVALGQNTVPPEVQSVLRLDPVNFQWQLDPPFWFLETAGQVSKNLNRIVNLESIDRTLSASATNVRKARSVLEVTSQRLKDARGRKAGLAWVERFDRDLRTVEGRRQEHREASRLLEDLRSLVEDVSRLAVAKDALRLAAESGGRVTAKADKLRTTVDMRETLSRLLSEVESARRARDKAVPDIGPLQSVRNDADGSAERRRFLGMLVTKLREAKEWRTEARERLSSAEKELEEKAPKLCRTCGQPVKSQSPSSPATGTYRQKLRSAGPKKKATGTVSWSAPSAR